MSAIVKAVANTENLNNNCVLISKIVNQLDGGSTVVYILFIDNKPCNHTVNFDRALGWYDKNQSDVLNPVEVVEIGHSECGSIHIKETR